MNKDKIVIHEQVKELVVGLFFLLIDCCLIAYHWSTNIESDTHYGFFATTLAAPFVIVFLTLSSAKKKGTIVISEQFIQVKYFYKKRSCLINLSEAVYYAIFIDLEDKNSYILISNEEFIFDKKILGGDIDYDLQIPIRYTKRVKKFLPKQNWIEIKWPEE